MRRTGIERVEEVRGVLLQSVKPLPTCGVEIAVEIVVSRNRTERYPRLGQRADAIEKGVPAAPDWRRSP